jgi:mannose-6-phosphate isomerase-like protein (cupin superfamily)
MKQGKVWGDTKLIFNNPVVEFHRIEVNQGYECSTHKHEHKWNGFFVESGQLEIHVNKNNYDLVDITTLNSGDFTVVRPGEFHKFVCTKDCVAFELYWPELLSEDIIRKNTGGKS